MIESEEELPDGRWRVSGHLPAGAVRALAIAPSGEEVTATIDDDGGFEVVGGRLMRFEDARGEVVPARRVAGSPIEDAEVDCPVCGARAWVLMEEDEPACVRCGFALQSSMVFTYAETDEAPDPLAEAAWRQEEKATMRRRLHGLAMPVFALAGVAARPGLAGWGGSDDTTTSVTVQHAGVDIRVEQRDRHVFALEHDLRGALETVLRHHDGPPPDLSHAAVHLWLDGLGREAARAAALAVRSDTPITVDGEPLDALRLVADDGWAAALDRGDVRIFLTSREPACALALRTLPDPMADLELLL